LEINTAFTAYFEAVYNDAHDDLVDTWQAIVEAYYLAEITLEGLNAFAAQMGEPVTITYESSPQKFTVDFAKEINNDMIYDPTFYYNMQTAWTTAAKAQYAQVLADLIDLIGN
jgi:hypothetical protein